MRTALLALCCIFALGIPLSAQTEQTDPHSVDQKIDNPDYQAIPADWDRDYYPKLLEKARAFEDLRRRIAAGEVKTQSKHAVLVGGTPRSPELRFLLARGVREMS